ncbi:carboxypeptidase-like regulatory domain-containing protein [Verrucosispora sioxanthis]|uniref:Carboxypeptidase regulatory-like domain-containing protein n=1 Tax=Verrucosispora sioxanthis TaxID=2499994 RepID=A0A6M1L5Y4_9ACTN|nr:carboxypeptidase-like regulatory domain-containing protein [Verrucosispora sioxanthis]NEE64254.1 carboxypeptidase regulatory-like domain-containing protein [Verrucosispora sioxanthis]NGM13364.1 carboxypeptidase regulatory-like domain-containing protein [Verrucosispora sioxanthis]
MPRSPRHAVPLTVALLVVSLPLPATASPGLARSAAAPRATVAAPSTPTFATASHRHEAGRTTVDTTAGEVRTTLRDRATGAAVRGCVSLVPVDRDRLTVVFQGEVQEGRHGGCTSVDGGDVLASNVPPGRYHLLARPYDTDQHGLQWVGRHGGTGQREHGVTIKVRPGRTVTAPTVHFDPPGAVTGRVTRAADGNPVSAGHVMSLPVVPDPKNSDYGAITDDDGRYTLTGLGPYRWPLYYTGYLLASQWSGGVADRRKADTVRVRSGTTVTSNQELVAGTVVSGTIAVDEMPNYSQVIAFHARTGDVTGVVDVGTDYTLRLLPGQRVLLRCDCAHVPSRWYPNAEQVSEAQPVRIGHTPVTADFDLTGPATDPAP